MPADNEEMEFADKVNPGGKVIYKEYTREFNQWGIPDWEELHPDTRNSWRQIAKKGWRAIQEKMENEMPVMPEMPEPCQPIGCDNGYHLPECPYASVDNAHD